MSGFRIILTKGLSLFFGFIFPAYGSITAIESSSSGDDTQWLVYWLLFSLTTIVESLLWPVFKWVPLYQEAKIAFIAWLVLPQTQGALWVYEALLHPGWQFIRKEISKNPALERMLARAEYGELGSQPSNEDISAQSEKRRSGLAQSIMNTSSRLESQLKSISSIPDYKERARAERQFDKELDRLSKIGGRSKTA